MNASANVPSSRFDLETQGCADRQTGDVSDVSFLRGIEHVAHVTAADMNVQAFGDVHACFQTSARPEHRKPLAATRRRHAAFETDLQREGDGNGRWQSAFGADADPSDSKLRSGQIVELNREWKSDDLADRAEQEAVARGKHRVRALRPSDARTGRQFVSARQAGGGCSRVLVGG